MPGIEPTDGLFVVIGADIAPLRSALSEASKLSGKFASDLTRAFTDASLKGKELADVLRSLALSLSTHALESALSPITKLFGNALAQLVGGAASAALPVPFASGGVIASPVAFPLGGGRPGIAGEAGPEAILPLARGRDGKLGVRAEGSAPSFHITFNVTTPDAKSFRRSEGQIAAMLHRAAARGQRNL
jgi:phage-related minor tail protein